MLMYRGKPMYNVMIQINAQERNPYDAVEAVLIDSAYPLRDESRKEFIAENMVVLDVMCREMHEEWCESNGGPVKRPTHAGTATLH